MNKIEEIEQLLKHWKAAKKKAYRAYDTKQGKICLAKCSVLKAALDILKRPSNTQMQIDGIEECNCINGIPQTTGGCKVHGVKY